MLRRPRYGVSTNGTLSPSPGTAAAAQVNGDAGASAAQVNGDAGSSRQTAVAEARGTLEPVETVDDEWIEHNGLRIAPDMRLVERDGKRVDLTRSEFELLACIMESGRRVVSKLTLALALRAEDYATGEYVSESERRTVEVHLANLRRKIGDSSSDPRWIETVRGVGYRLAEPTHPRP